MGKSKLRKFIRVGAWTGLGLVVLLVTGIFCLNRYVPNLIRNKIHHMVVNGSDSLYSCSIDKISVNLWLGKVSVEGVNISVDSVKYREQKLSGRLPNITFELKMLKGSIKGLQVFPLIFSKKIRIDAIEVDSAAIAMCRQFKEKKKAAPSEESLWRMMKPVINGIYVNEILLNKIKFSYRHSEDKKDVSLAYQDCSVKLQHIRIDSIGAANSSRILFTEDIAIRLVGLNYFTPDSLYHLKIDSLSYSSFLKKVISKNLDLQPTITPIAFTRKHGMQVDIFEASIPDLTAINFQIEKIFTENELCFDTIILKKPILNIHRDRTAHYDTTSQLGKYPNEALLAAPFIVRVPLMLLEDAEIHYIERQKLSLKTGDAYFSHVTGSISNITNKKEDIEKNSHCKMDLHGFFLTHGRLKVKFDFDLASPEGAYTASADLGSMKANELNTIFIPFANIELKSLTIDEGHVKFRGNHKGITGVARILYHDLKIEILGVDAKTHKTKKQGFISFFANLVAVRSHNKMGKKEVIADHIYVERKRRQPFANLIWEFFFESMKKIILKVPAKNLKVEM